MNDDATPSAGRDAGPPEGRDAPLPVPPPESTALTEPSIGAKLVPYAGAGALATVAMTALVVGTAIPTAGILKFGFTYLAVAMAMRWVEELDIDSDNAVVRWLAQRGDALGDKFGVEFYGISALTAFFWAEVSTLSLLSVPLSRLLADPIGVAVALFVEGILESIMNVLSAALWFLQLFQAPGVGTGTGFLIVAAGWAVWRVLDMPPRNPKSLVEDLQEELRALRDDVDDDLDRLADGP